MTSDAHRATGAPEVAQARLEDALVAAVPAVAPLSPAAAAAMAQQARHSAPPVPLWLVVLDDVARVGAAGLAAAVACCVLALGAAHLAGSAAALDEEHEADAWLAAVLPAPAGTVPAPVGAGTVPGAVEHGLDGRFP